MKKLIVLTAVTSILLIGGSQQAWAGNKAKHGNDDYRTVKKVVRVLDVLVNDHHRKGGRRVYVRTCRQPERICYYKGRRIACTKRSGDCCQYKNNRHYKQYSRKW